MNDQALITLSKAQLALAECKTAMEAKQVADIAEAARVYLERTNASIETVNRATEVRLLAERQMGAFLKTMPKAKGGAHHHSEDSPKAPSITVKPERTVKTMAEIGITHNQAERAQKLADIPEPEFQERIAVAKASEGKLTTNAILQPQRRKSEGFNLAAWKRQARSIMIAWLRSVPEHEREDAARFLSNLPSEIINDNQQ